ncbi:MAG TPA: hypothetical protein VN455_07190 [Methanotrichaceae archaeon]|nr:hypothetical protein [Methanotrichaceae archaeon]
MRKLNEKDLEILRKLAPEIEEKLKSGRKLEYRSILPPVSMHFAQDEEDFKDRLERLSPDELAYLAGRILDESECLLCISPEFARIFMDVLAYKVSDDVAEKVKALYKSATGYD